MRRIKKRPLKTRYVNQRSPILNLGGGRVTSSGGSSSPKGSEYRGYNSIAAIGGPEGSTVADGAEGVESYTIEETCLLGRLYITDSDALAAVSTIKINNDDLITGFLPPSMFSGDALWSPKFGHIVTPQDTLKVGRTNQTGGSASFESGFSTVEANPNRYPGGAYSGRSLVAVGGPDDTTITANTTTTLTFTLTEPGQLGRLVLDFIGTFDWDDHLVKSIKYDNDEMISGYVPAAIFKSDSPSSPVFGQVVEPGHSLKIVLENQHATNAPKGWAGFTVV